MANEETRLDQFEAKTKWDSEVDIPTIYANELYMGHTDKEFFIIFGEYQYPIFVPGKDEIPEEVVIKPRVRIVVSHQAMLEFVNAINQNVGRFLERQHISQNEEDE